jgi:hypothetical protein
MLSPQAPIPISMGDEIDERAVLDSVYALFSDCARVTGNLETIRFGTPESAAIGSVVSAIAIA